VISDISPADQFDVWVLAAACCCCLLLLLLRLLLLSSAAAVLHLRYTLGAWV